MIDTDKIRTIMLSTRKKMELIAKKESFGKDLCGLCARASAELFKRLQKNGYKPYFCFSEAHCFVLLNNYILDVTATQFGRKSIEIIPFNQFKRQYWYLGKGCKHHSLKQAKRIQKRYNWPKDQLI